MMGALGWIAWILGWLCLVMGILTATEVGSIEITGLDWTFWSAQAGILLLGSIAIALSCRAQE